MSGRNIALTGVPRSGTTLACRLLGQAVDTVALFEPMDVAGLPPERGEALSQIAGFFDASRASLLGEGVAWSQQVGGQVPDNPFASSADAMGRRLHEAVLGQVRIDKPLSPGFTLVVKHNAAFTALLPELAERFETWAVVRNPLAVLASWHSVDLPVTRGRLPAGERLDPALARRLDAEPDRVARQLLILDWLFACYAQHLPASRVLAYEDVVATGACSLANATGVAVPSLVLEERNSSRLYDLAHCQRMAERLLADDGAWRSRYDDAAVLDVLAKLGERAS